MENPHVKEIKPANGQFFHCNEHPNTADSTKGMASKSLSSTTEISECSSKLGRSRIKSPVDCY